MPMSFERLSDSKDGFYGRQEATQTHPDTDEMQKR